MSDPSPAQLLASRLVVAIGRQQAHRAIDVVLAKFTTTELAAIAAYWPLWARPKQRPPTSAWRSFGFITGRGFGKTKGIVEHINEEVSEGRAMNIGLIAQKEDKTVDIQVTGPSGLIATAPPWSKPHYESSAKQLVWPNGARAYILTPEAPGAIRGVDYHLSWCTEIQSWPVATREEAFSNILFTTRLGYARLLWDATPKRGHPILKQLLARSAEQPDKHLVVRGTTHENAGNLGDGVVEDLERQYAGTQKGREELGGEMLEESENTVAKQAWIDQARRHMPERFARRGLGIDPAVTERKSSDMTGIVEAGLGVDGQGHVVGNYSGKYDPPTWGKIALDKYVQNGCDIIVVETNKGGSLVTQNLRAAASERKLTVVVVEKDQRPQRVAGTVFVKEVHSRGEKMDRAQPLSTAYQLGRVSHVFGVDLESLEETITTWEPSLGGRSPDDLDALTHIMGELLDLHRNVIDARAGFRGLEDLGKAIGNAPKAIAAANLAALLGGGDTRGGRI